MDRSDETRAAEESEASVPASPTSADEVTSSDPVVDSGTAAEDRASSSASGVPADDPADDHKRRKAYSDGASLVSRID
jgi:hypothetical protein